MIKTFAQKTILVVFGVCLGLLLLLVITYLASFYFKINNAIHNARKKDHSVIRILCIGESTTALSLGCSPYSIQLEQLLNAQGTKRFSVYNEGVPAITTEDILKKVPHWIDQYSPHYVVSMMGVNDSHLYTDRCMGLSFLAQKVPLFKLFYILHESFRLKFGHRLKADWKGMNRARNFNDIDLGNRNIGKVMKVFEDDSCNYQHAGLIAQCYLARGESSRAEEFFRVAENLRFQYYGRLDSPTKANYCALKKILDIKGITYICMSYPCISTDMFSLFFTPLEQKEIIFVDNEKCFKDGIKMNGYRRYFIDVFAGEFGHCTKKGNELIARNLASAILQDLNIKKTLS